MKLRAEDITIAVTVYNRRGFVFGAIRSALDQTVPVKVVVVEDCGPDATLQDGIVNEFDDRIEYFRNPQNRGLFENWNACMEYCRTPWLSILHDDDLLRPNFVETMLALFKQAPDRALYYGQHARWMPDGKIYPVPKISWKGQWRDIDLRELAEQSVLGFAGQLFNVANAQAAGGFRKNCYYTGDWDMWFRLAVHFGAVETVEEVAVGRSHNSVERGTSLVLRKGWKWTLDNVQRKRNLTLLRCEKGIVMPFERAKFLQQNPISPRLLMHFAHGYSRRMLAYNVWLFTHSRPPNRRYAVLQWLMRLFGHQMLRMASVLRKEKVQQ